MTTMTAGAVGAVSLGGRRVYAYIVHEKMHGAGQRWRVRVSLDDYESVGLHPFSWVRVGLHGGREAVLYFAGVDEEPPAVWLDLCSCEPW